MADSPYFFESSLLKLAGFSHAFSTRRGGYSAGVFKSLNFATQTGDPDELVLKNLGVIAAQLGIQPQQLYFMTQVHGVRVLTIEGTENRGEVLKENGDILVTKHSASAVAVRSADCVPVLLACPETGWVAACHAGWQGCVRGAVPAAVHALISQGATQPLAAIGPHISHSSFEVSLDVSQELLNASPDKNIVTYCGEKAHVNLRKMVRSQLNQAGVKNESIDDVLGCTVLDEHNFFSYRRDNNPSGRMLSAIVGKR